MKKLICTFLLFACLSTFGIKAQTSVQFSNNGFEQWSSSVPTGWSTLGYMGYNLCDISKSTQHHGGDFSVKIAPKQLPSFIANMLNVSQFAIPGMISNGELDIEALSSSLQGLSGLDSNSLTEDYLALANSFKDILINGLRIEALPETIEGYYKLSSPDNKDIFAIVAYTKVNGSDSSYISGGGIYYDYLNTDDFENFSIEMNYLSEQIPDELYLVAIALNMDSSASEYGNVLLDDININYQTSSSCATLTDKSEELAIYPNPTTNGSFVIDLQNDSLVEIYDIMGRKVKTIERYVPKSRIDLEKSGVYLVKVAGQTVKVVVDR